MKAKHIREYFLKWWKSSLDHIHYLLLASDAFFEKVFSLHVFLTINIDMMMQNTESYILFSPLN